jgi:hypothetical protein
VTATGVTLVKPSISSDPSSRTNLASTTATFSVTANGGALSYQWRKTGTPLTDGVKISGSGTSLLTISNVLIADAAGYSVLVTNASGSVTSAVAMLTVIDPALTTQPLSRTNLLGDTANFSVVAAGTATLTHHWQFNGSYLASQTGTSLSVQNAQATSQGGYSVVVSNGLGASITSSVANLALLSTPATRLARWDFNGTNLLSPSTPAPASGSGTASLAGGATADFSTGSPSDSAGTPGAANSGWNSTSFPSQGTANKTGGVQFKVSTVGYKNILLTWEERHSNSASKYARLRYSTDGTSFIDGPVIIMSATDNSFVFYSADLSAVLSVNNNPNFAFQIVSEFESTAIGTANNNYIGTGLSYSAAGTIRFDLVNVFGNPTNGVSPVSMKIQRLGTNVVLSWNDPSFFLQSSLVVTGGYSKITGATSPFTNPANGNRQFFRLVSP